MSGGPTGAGTFEDRYFTVRDGLKLHFRDYPGRTSRPPLLCLPGLTRNSRDFARVAETFSPSFRVLALEFRGRGSSDYDPMPERYLPTTYAADVIELLDHLTVDRAIFVGTSLGGLVTMPVAARSSERIAASILNDIGPELMTAGLDRIRGYVGVDARFGSWDEAAERIAANSSYMPARYSHEDWVKMAHRVCREDDGAIRFDYDFAIALPFDTRGAVPSIDMWPLFKALGEHPLLVVRGEQSDLLSAAALERMHEAVPAMQSVTVPGVAHAPMLDEPEAVEAIRAFLGSLRF